MPFETRETDAVPTGEFAPQSAIPVNVGNAAVAP